MPSTSKSQQRLMGMVYAYKSGKLELDDLPDSLSKKIKGIADGTRKKTGDRRRKTKGIDTDSAKHYASTKHKGLPEKVKEHIILKFEQFILEKYDKMGDLKKVMTIEQIAKKHKMDIKELEKSLSVGITIEREHTDNREVAERIALKHLEESPLYYHEKYGLPEMEKRLDKMEKEKREKEEE